MGKTAYIYDMSERKRTQGKNPMGNIRDKNEKSSGVSSWKIQS
jgi:hypothetical protein